MNSTDILKELTLEEKARLVNGDSFFGMYALTRLGLPRLQFLDGGTGINFEQLFGDYAQTREEFGDGTNGMTSNLSLIHVIDNFYEPHLLNDEEKSLREIIKKILDSNTHMPNYAPACFPAGISLGATWNPDIVYQVGDSLGLEANLYNVDVLLGTPNVNILRDPRNGRIFEGYSEDPCLVKMLAPMLVKGVQKHGVAANVKHFAANNQETNRIGIDETISKRALEEIYFPGFKACVVDGKCMTVMSAYNKINGVLCTDNKWLLTEKLRNDWGFEGMVVSDWGAVKHDVEAILAGNDLAMPGPRDYKKILSAVEDGELSEEALDKSVIRLLNLIVWIMNQRTKPTIDEKEQELVTSRAAYEAAAESITLLKNEGILPIKSTSNIALCGNEPEKLLACGTGSAGITTNRILSFYECLVKEFTKDKIHINQVSEDTDYIIYVVKEIGMEGNDRKSLAIPRDDVERLNSYDKPIILILNTCGPVTFAGICEEKIKAIVNLFLPGMEVARALTDILLGKINPSGKLPITFPMREEDMPTYLNFPGDGYKVNYGEGIFVGYRYYDTVGVKPRYPFGYGLSYTEFEITDLCIEKELSYSVNIKNTGQMRGAEVVQLYIKDIVSTLRKPKKELKAFKKVWLNPGEEKRVRFDLSYSDFASYDADFEEFVTEEGYYDIIIATSSDDANIRECCRIYLNVKSRYSYGLDSSIRILFEEEDIHQLLVEFWNKAGFDIGILLSTYQYTSNMTLREILPKEVDVELLNVFLEKLIKIEKR